MENDPKPIDAIDAFQQAIEAMNAFAEALEVIWAPAIRKIVEGVIHAHQRREAEILLALKSLEQPHFHNKSDEDDDNSQSAFETLAAMLDEYLALLPDSVDAFLTTYPECLDTEYVPPKGGLLIVLRNRGPPLASRQGGPFIFGRKRKTNNKLYVILQYGPDVLQLPSGPIGFFMTVVSLWQILQGILNRTIMPCNAVYYYCSNCLVSIDTEQHGYLEFYVFNDCDEIDYLDSVYQRQSDGEFLAVWEYEPERHRNPLSIYSDAEKQALLSIIVAHANFHKLLTQHKPALLGLNFAEALADTMRRNAIAQWEKRPCVWDIRQYYRRDFRTFDFPFPTLSEV